MTRFRAVFVAVALVVLSAGVVFAFEPLPDASATGLDRATEASGKTQPARPASAPGQAIAEAARAAITLATADAAAHGAAVSEAARAEDATPDTNHGQDVSVVARDNHGQATAAEHKPADAGAPEGVGKPEGAGKPDNPGQPEAPGAPEGAGKPDGVGRP